MGRKDDTTNRQRNGKEHERKDGESESKNERNKRLKNEDTRESTFFQKQSLSCDKY